MALGRPGLEPCVPLEVRFESCYWSAEQRHTSRPRLSVGLDLLPALDLKNVPRDSQSPSPVSPVFHHLTPDAKFHSHPAFSSLLKSLPLTSCSHLSLCNILGGSHSCKDSVLPTFFKKKKCFSLFSSGAFHYMKPPTWPEQEKGFVAPLTFIAKETSLQPWGQLQREGWLVEGVEGYFRFFFCYKKQSRWTCSHSDGKEKLKDQKVQPLLLPGICFDRTKHRWWFHP